jgi:hypothetical protein
VAHLLSGRPVKASQALWSAMRLFLDSRKSRKDGMFRDLATDMAHLYFNKAYGLELGLETMDVPVLLRACCETAFHSSHKSPTSEALATKYQWRSDASKALYVAFAGAAAQATEKKRNHQFHSSVLQWKGMSFWSEYFANSHVFLADVREAYTPLQNVKLAVLSYCKDPCVNSSCSFRIEAKLKCSKCKIARYCCKECQVTHWKDHKAHCVGKASEATVTKSGKGK